jgi:hypothetical protein
VLVVRLTTTDAITALVGEALRSRSHWVLVADAENHAGTLVGFAANLRLRGVGDQDLTYGSCPWLCADARRAGAGAFLTVRKSALTAADLNAFLAWVGRDGPAPPAADEGHDVVSPAAVGASRRFMRAEAGDAHVQRTGYPGTMGGSRPRGRRRPLTVP